MATRPVAFSIITVCLNCRDALEMTLNSVFRQTYPHVERIVIDGASIDGTPEYLASVRSSLSVVISEPDTGIYDAMNKGIRVATGDYILFLNAGDRFLQTDVLARLAVDPVVLSRSLPIVSGRVQYEFDGNLVELYRPRVRGPEGPGLPHQATLVAASVQKANEFDQKLRFVGDYELWLRLRERKSFTVHYLDLVVATFAQGGASTNPRNDFPRYLERAYVDARYGKVFDGLAWLRIGTTVLARRLLMLLLGPRLLLQISQIFRT
jgi:glycosyltransferase involved in cell wall biosynthesis